jgi:hypothetical protein
LCIEFEVFDDLEELKKYGKKYCCLILSKDKNIYVKCKNEFDSKIFVFNENPMCKLVINYNIIEECFDI